MPILAAGDGPGQRSSALAPITPRKLALVLPKSDVGPPLQSSAPARSTANQVRAHDLHTPHCKRLISIVNRTDPSSGRRIIDALRPSLSWSFRVQPVVTIWTYWWSYLRPNAITRGVQYRCYAKFGQGW